MVHGSPVRVLGRAITLLLAVIATAVGTTGSATGDDPSRPADPGADRSLQEALERDRAEQQRRATPAAREQRQRSRSAYAMQSRAEALATARSAFAGFVALPFWRKPQLLPGEEIVRYTGGFSATVSRDRGRDLILESTAPLRARTESGELEPIDTELVPSGGDLVPANVPFAARIARDASDGVALGDPEIRIRAVGGGAASSAQVDGDKAFFANVGDGPDTDLIAGVVPGGVELAFQLRSAESPRELTLGYELPAGAELRVQNELGSAGNAAPGGATIVKDGRTLARISSPIVSDADGQPVPAALEARAGALVIDVDHRGRDLRYPLLADPVVTEDYDTGDFANNVNNSPSEWEYYETDTDFTGSQSGTTPHGVGLKLNMLGGGCCNYPAGSLSQWTWRAPVDSKIVKTAFEGIAHDLNSSLVRLGISSNGIWQGWQGNLVNGVPTPHTITGNQTNTSRWVCTDPVCGNTGSATYQNHTVFRFESTGGGNPRANANSAALSQALMWLSEPYAPNFVSVSGQRPQGWVDDSAPNDTFQVDAHDKGLGLDKLTFERPAGTTPITIQDLVCPFTARSPCFSDWDFPSYSYSIASLPEGDNTLDLNLVDMIGNTATNSWQVKVDRSPPTIALSGTLYNNRTPQTQFLLDGTYALHIDATDGSNSSSSAKRSGVASIVVYVDGEERELVEQDCAAGSCSMAFDWTLSATDLDSGAHEIEVNATDQGGHVSSQSFTVNRLCCMSSVAIWGDFTGYTGALYADVNADGIDDAVARDSWGDVDVMLGTGAGYGAEQEWGSFGTSWSFNLADVNGDGRSDLIGTDAGGNVAVALSDGTQFGASTTWATLAGSYTPYFADLSGDGADDLVGINHATGAMTAAYSVGTDFESTFTSAGSAELNYAYTFADMDGDAVEDLVETKDSTGEVRVGLVEGGVAAVPAAWGTFGGGDKLMFEDVDGDEQADAVAVDNASAQVDVRTSNAEGLDAAEDYGMWNNTYEEQLADVDGDGTADIVGQNAAGVIAGAVTAGPEPKGVDAGYTTDLTPSQYGNDVVPGKKPTFAFQDQRVLYGRVQPGANLATANPDQVHVYQRLKQAGATVIRFNAVWGSIETRSGSPAYDFTHLDRVVTLAKQQGFDVHLTITGADAQNNCDGKNLDTIGCGSDDPSNLRGCADGAKYASASLNPEEPTGISTDQGDPRNNYDCFVDNYKEFARAVIDHYTRDGAGASLAVTPPAASRFVRTFSIWNEPNGNDWLRDQNDAALIPTKLYRRLYEEGYEAYSESINAAPALASESTQILIGELSAGHWKGGHTSDSLPPHGTSTTRQLTCARNCTMSPLAFLATIAKNASQPLLADGIAYHPYQQSIPPWKHYKSCATKYTGIGRAGLIGRQRDVLFLPGSHGDEKCLYRTDYQKLKTPDGKAPPLFFTEFGYLNRPLNKEEDSRRLFHNESERALWFYGDESKQRQQTKRAGAIERSGKAKWLVFYHAVEMPRPTDANAKQPWDSGLIGNPEYDPLPNDPNNPLTYDDPAHPNQDIKGLRLYNKRPRRKGKFSLDPVARKAYCKIRLWAFKEGYPGASKCPPSENP